MPFGTKGLSFARTAPRFAAQAFTISRPLSRCLATLPPRHAALRLYNRTSPRTMGLNESQTPSLFNSRFLSTGRTAVTPPTQPTCSTILNQPGEPNVYSFFEKETSTWQYLIIDPSTNKAVIIDTVLNYDPASGVISTSTADGLLAFIKHENVDVTMILETHAHADHLSAAQYFKQQLGGNVPVAIGKRITQVQERFGRVYKVPNELTNSPFDKYWEDDEKFKIGDLDCQVFHLPGHTPDHVGYMCGNGLFVGDTLFYPDVGSARADFPGGSPIDLYKSIKRILSLSPDTRIYAGHDYPPENAGEGSERCWSLVSEQRERNIHLKGRIAEIAESTSEEDASKLTEQLQNSFIEWRGKRDSVLGAPRLLHPSLQVNICAGRLPLADEEGRRMFSIPLKIPRGL